MFGGKASENLHLSDLSMPANPIPNPNHVQWYNGRFSDMRTEWILMWGHFLWSSIFVVAFSVRAIWLTRLGKILSKGASKQSEIDRISKKVEKQRQRLLYISLTACLWLLLNMTTNLIISLKLERFNETSDLFLECSLRESWNIRDWDSYGLGPDSSKKVCSAEESIDVIWPCIQDCVWHPETFNEFLVCQYYDELRRKESPPVYLQDAQNVNPCDCPCDKLVTVERPSVVVMTLAFVAQTAVASTMGLILTFSIIRTMKVDWRVSMSILFSIIGRRHRKNKVFNNSEGFLSCKKRLKDAHSKESSAAPRGDRLGIDFRLQILGSAGGTNSDGLKYHPDATSND